MRGTQLDADRLIVSALPHVSSQTSVQPPIVYRKTAFYKQPSEKLKLIETLLENNHVNDHDCNLHLLLPALCKACWL